MILLGCVIWVWANVGFGGNMFHGVPFIFVGFSNQRSVGILLLQLLSARSWLWCFHGDFCWKMSMLCVGLCTDSGYSNPDMVQGKNAGTNEKVRDFPFNQSIEIHGIKQAGTIAISVLRLLPPTSAGFDRICDIPIYPKKKHAFTFWWFSPSQVISGRIDKSISFQATWSLDSCCVQHRPTCYKLVTDEPIKLWINLQ